MLGVDLRDGVGCSTLTSAASRDSARSPSANHCASVSAAPGSTVRRSSGRNVGDAGTATLVQGNPASTPTASAASRTEVSAARRVTSRAHGAARCRCRPARAPAPRRPAAVACAPSGSGAQRDPARSRARLAAGWPCSATRCSDSRVAVRTSVEGMVVMRHCLAGPPGVTRAHGRRLHAHEQFTGCRTRPGCDADNGGAPWRALGARTCRERAWGTVREDYSADGDAWDYFPHDHARSRAYRWNEDGLAGICDDRQTLLPRAGVLERRRPDPEGAHLRPHRPRGQPRRGRQGVLVVPRLHADALVDALALPLPAARVPLRATWSPRTPRAAATSPSSSSSTPASSTTTATGWSRSTTPRPRPTTCCMRITVQNAGPDEATPARAADALVPQHLVVGLTAATTPADLRLDGRRAASPSTAASAALVLAGDGQPEPLFCENETNAERLFGVRRADRRTRRTASTTTWCTARRRSTPSSRHQGRAALPRSTVPAGGTAEIRVRLAPGAEPAAVDRARTSTR